MRNERVKAAHDINNQLRVAERAIDTALCEAAQLTACMLKARIAANIAAQVGHGAMERSAASIAALVQARREMIEAHQELNAAKDLVGLRTLAMGGDDKSITTTTGQHLSVVAAA